MIRPQMPMKRIGAREEKSYCKKQERREVSERMGKEERKEDALWFGR